MADSAEIGFAGDVVQVCISASSKLLKEARQHDAGKLIEKQLQDDVDRLRLWADGFEIKAGELDILLEKDDQMKTAVIANLGSVASLLSKATCRFLQDKDLSIRLRTLVEKAILIEPRTEHLFDYSSDEEEQGPERVPGDLRAGQNKEDGEDEVDEAWSAFCEDFSDLCQLLFDFAPFLMELQETGMISNEPQEDDTTKPVTSGEQCDLPHKHLRRMIMDKFPEGDPQLIERIATECWTLYCGLKEGYAESEKQARKDAHSDRDSGNGSKLQSKAVRIALSILKDFENSNVEKNICFDEHFPHSYSFPGAPSPPVPLKIGPLFLCTICSKLVPVFSDVDIWRRHIFDHISPYICTFQDCPERQHRFSSLSSWTDHEFNCHRKPSKWQCIFCLPCSEQSYIYFGLRNFEAHLDLVHRECYSAEDKFSIMEKCKRSPVKNTAKKATCPFCATELQNKRRMIAGHVGRHLEDIALPIASIFLAAEESDREFIDSNSAGVSDNLLSNPEHNLPKCNETGSCLWGLSKADWKHVIGGRSTENELHKHMNPQHDADPLFPDFPFSCFEHESNQESSYDQHMKWKYDLDSVLGMNYDNQPHHYAKSRDSVAPCSSTPDREPEDGGPEFPALLRLMRSKIHHYAGERPSENIFDEKVQELESPASKIIQEQQLREELQKIFFRRAGFLLSKNPGPFTPEHNNNSSLVDEPRVSSETVTRDISFCHICEEVNLTLPIIYCKIGKCRKRWHRKCQTARDVIYQEYDGYCDSCFEEELLSLVSEDEDEDEDDSEGEEDDDE